MLKKLKHIILFSLLIVSLSGCYDNYISSIPNSLVSLRLNLTTTYPNLKDNPYQFEQFVKPNFQGEAVGFGGVLVVCGFGTNNLFDYFAYDLACPYEAQANIKVTPNDIGQAVCETCGSVYEIIYGIGNPIEGPSKETLKRYKTSLQGDWLIISN
ncbi:MAG: hypothetical protein Q7J05_06030 [Paludibacter sp.]|nr:hypothetical protein [Paludibacter sp.]